MVFMMHYQFIREIIEIKKNVSAEAMSYFSSDDTIFNDHFPGTPLVPGALMVELMAQTAGWLIGYSTDFAKKSVLATVDNAKFRHNVRPEMAIFSSVQLTAIHHNRAAVKAKIEIPMEHKRQLCASADIGFYLHDLNDQPSENSIFNKAQIQPWMKKSFQDLARKLSIE
ncbi:MAG: hypothetical protein AAF984_03255 [Verrucomicrobiota bacterium]